MAVNKLDLLKDTLELARNYFFAGGMVVLGGSVIYSPESIGVPATGYVLATTIILSAFAYMALAIWYFEAKHWPDRFKGTWPYLFFLGRLLFLLALLEGSLGIVARHTDWAHNREVAAARATRAIPPVAIPAPLSRCIAGH